MEFHRRTIKDQEASSKKYFHAWSTLKRMFIKWELDCSYHLCDLLAVLDDADGILEFIEMSPTKNRQESIVPFLEITEALVTVRLCKDDQENTFAMLASKPGKHLCSSN
ncbi:hypothetical protein IFM89_009433 [Coptis chinensis]|uniref:Uncharacterized protein n=1 Tax=Coptis chinensis TaxID=261450 RepID=A0A835IB89_9MAGN|nr:hypothetical protein IFM89_009433 [Coptis chinensis]